MICFFNRIRLFCLLFALPFFYCAASFESVDLTAIDSKASPFWNTIAGCYDMHSWIFKKNASPKDHAKFDLNKNKYYIDILPGGYFLNVKIGNNKLLECRRGMWGLKDSSLIFKYYEISKGFLKDSVIFAPNRYLVTWRLAGVSDSMLVLKDNSFIRKIFPSDTVLYTKCKNHMIFND